MNRIYLICILTYVPVLVFAQTANVQKILTGPGPEDIVIAEFDTATLILASCAPRSKVIGEPGIYLVDIENGSSKPMPRRLEPDSILFMPHGITFAEVEETPYLYVITHDDKRDLHPVCRYIVHHEFLEYDTAFSHPLLMSPNALTVLEDGSFFLVNDSRNRSSILEKILPLKRSTVVRYTSDGSWSIVASRIAMATGIAHHDNSLFVSATRQNKILRYQIGEDGTLTHRRPLDVPGPDNLRISGSELFIASHTKPMKLARHIMNPERLAPTQIIRYDLTSDSMQQIFYDDGSRICGASVALPADGMLIMGQIVESFVLASPEP